MNCENEKKVNLSDRLLEKRTVLVFGALDSKKAGKIIASLLYLEGADQEAPITMYINSEGGNEMDILAVFDVMKHLFCPVETVCVGKAYGLTALLLAGGTKGMRKAYANSEVMLAQVQHERTFGQASDIELETEHLLRVKERVNRILAELCGCDAQKVKNDLERKFWLFAEEAKDYGIIDALIK